MSKPKYLTFSKLLERLNSYLGIRGSDDLIKQLLVPNQAIDQEKQGPFENLASSLLSLQGSAQTTQELYSALDEYCRSSGDSDQLQDKLKDGESPVLLTTFEGGSNPEFAFQRKGSIKELLAQDQTSSVPINCIELADSRLGFSNRDASTVASFLKVLPSVEISKAVPYFDCKIITTTRVDDVGDVTDQARFDNGISIYRFLDGKIEEGKDTEKQIVLAKFAPGQTVQREILNNTTDQVQVDLSNASMELFTSPQTLVNGNDKFYDLDASKAGIAGIGDDVGKKSILDPFRPLMTFESFNLSVTPHSGLITTKAADVKLKLHDRSRMGEIAPLLSPARLNEVELHITWGWSHPQSNPNENIYGALIDRMKVTEKYGVSNSSYTFTPEGQVDITLKLYTKGAQNIAFDLLKGNKTSHPIDVMTEAITQVREAVRNLRGEGFNLKDDLGAPDFLGKASSTRGMLTLSEEQVKELEEFIKSLKKNTKNSAAFTKLADSLDAAKSSTKDYQDEVGEELDKKIASLKDGTDPWLLAQGPIKVGKVTAVPAIDITTHVSLAKFILQFVAEPLSQSGKFKEVQTVYYGMNDFAMWAKDLTVAQYPLNIKILEGIFKEELLKSPTLKMQTLLNIVQRMFMNSSADDIYGFSSFYSYNEESGKIELNKKYREDKSEKQKLAMKKHDIMKECYGEASSTIRRFKKPNITMFVETLPISSDGTDTDQPGSILRLHFFDKNATSYSTYEQLWQSTSKSELGVIGQFASALKKQKYLSKRKNISKKDKERIKKHNEAVDKQQRKVDNLREQHSKTLQKLEEQGLLEQIGNTGKYRIKGGPNQLRAIMTANMPTLKYGTEFSGILTANLSTQSNPQMETIHMQRARRNRSTPLDGGSDGLPLRVKPAQLSLDTFGCPLINFGQQFFVDFNTNSSIDDIYAVVGISHSLSPSDFKTQVKLVPLQKFGQFGTVVDSLSDIKDIADDAGK